MYYCVKINDMELKRYDFKIFWEYELSDYWNLNDHPLYIKLISKREAPYFKISEQDFEGSTKISSLTAFVRYYSAFDWLLVSKTKTEKVIKLTQSMINIPWSPLK